MKKFYVISALLICAGAVTALPAIDVDNIFASVNQEQSGAYECPWKFVSGGLNTKGTCIVGKYGEERMFSACGMYGNYKNDEQIINGINEGKCKFVPGDKWPY